MKIKIICEMCKQDTVLKDAWASWNIETQDWELANTFDDNYCSNCECECRGEEMEIE